MSTTFDPAPARVRARTRRGTARRPDHRAASAAAPQAIRVALDGPRVLAAFALAAVGAGTARGLTTSYLPVLLERINDASTLIGVVMMVNAIAGFAVPLVVGPLSDRREAGARDGRRLPYMVGGTVVAAGGLLAVGLGNGASYLALALAAAVVYTGLNALTTAHRAIVADDVADERRPAVASALELAGTAGGALAVGIGGALIDPAPTLAFALAGLVLAASMGPTLLTSRRLGLGTAPRPMPTTGARASLRAALHRPGPRNVLQAQMAWCLAYAALPTFFVLYAEDALGLGLGLAGALLLGFGAFTALGMALAARVRTERVYRAIVLSAALVGAGLLLAATSERIELVVAPLAAAGFGAGLLTSLGFPYFARFVPEGEAGGYSGLFFASRGIASALALPAAGVAVELTGTYRGVLLLGVGALVAVVPLRAAERRRAAAARISPAPAPVAAVIPVYASERAAEVAWTTLPHVDRLVLVDDGAPPRVARTLAPLVGDPRVRLITLDANHGKGTAVSTGITALLAARERPEAIVVLDSDGQHDPSRIPAFIEASRAADVVLGSRTRRRAMPLRRRMGNRAASLALLASSRTWIPDSQNGMRLFRVPVLLETPLRPGGFEAEARHLRGLLASGRRVAAVEIPTIYEGEPSRFRAVADSLAIARALLSRPRRTRSGEGKRSASVAVLRAWVPRLLVATSAAIATGVLLPLLQPLDNALFRAINGLGDGPGWLYAALDPHTRNYLLLWLTTVLVSAVVWRRPGLVLGAALAVVLAGFAAGAVLEFVKLFVERARPEEVLGSEAQLSHGRRWGHIASYPSGHLIVTTAMAAAASLWVPVLRRPLLAYVVAVGVTRVLFGAHFPLDVAVGIGLGYVAGALTARLVAALIPAARLVHTPASRPATQAIGVREDLRCGDRRPPLITSGWRSFRWRARELSERS